MTSRRLSIQPVWGMGERQLSNDVLDTAETLMENIDQLAEVLDNLAEKYNTEIGKLSTGTSEEVIVVITDPQGKTHDTKGNTCDTQENTEDLQEKSRDLQENKSPREMNMFYKLKTCIDSTRHLIESLRKEKSRLMKRELSVECKLGEIEDYKTHVKHDLSSLNEMVDLLTTKVYTLETQLCDEQEKSESLKFERDELTNRLKHSESARKDEEERSVRLRLENKELNYQNEVLIVENAKLKDFLRERTEGFDGDNSGKPLTSKDRKSSASLLPDLIEDSGSNDNAHINEETVTIRL